MKKQTKGRIYVAGKMRGVKLYNFPAFDAARDTLAAEGWEVISPADMDRAYGFDPIKDPSAVATPDFIDDAMRRDIEAVMDPGTTAIYMLDGWETSEGANIEIALALWRRLEVIYQSEPCEKVAISDIISQETEDGVLQTAIKITSGDRRRDYDSATPNHQRIADGWNWYIGARKSPLAPLSPLDASNMMILLKLARACYTPTRDTFVDIAGYARCSAQISGFEKE